MTKRKPDQPRERRQPPFPLPDFNTMYRNSPCRVSPRLAYYLWFELRRIAALWNAELELGTDLATSDLVRCLPRIAQFHATTDFLHRIVNATDDLRRRLEHGDLPGDELARNTAEQYILNTTLDSVTSTLIETPEIIRFEHLDDFVEPDEDDCDYDLIWYRQTLVEDHDVLMLFLPELDGIERDASLYAQLNLNPPCVISVWWVSASGAVDLCAEDVGRGVGASGGWCWGWAGFRRPGAPVGGRAGGSAQVVS